MILRCRSCFVVVVMDFRDVCRGVDSLVMRLPYCSLRTACPEVCYFAVCFAGLRVGKEMGMGICCRAQSRAVSFFLVFSGCFPMFFGVF